MTDHITNCIRKCEPVCFTKLGDGEMATIVYGDKNCRQHNCDGTIYSAQLKKALFDAVNEVLIPAAVSSQTPNVFLGGWHVQASRDFWDTTFHCSVPWVHYHTLIFDNADFAGGETALQSKLSLYRSIRESSPTIRNKILICNEYVAPRMQILLGANYVIHVPLHNWYCDGIYDQVKDKLFRILHMPRTQAGNAIAENIVVFAGGIVSKVLIADCLRVFPHEIYLDIGSALDLLCTKRDSRGWNYTYEDIESAAREANLLPPEYDAEWNDPRLEELVFGPAQTHLGIHLPRRKNL